MFLLVFARVCSPLDDWNRLRLKHNEMQTQIQEKPKCGTINLPLAVLMMREQDAFYFGSLFTASIFRKRLLANRCLSGFNVYRFPSKRANAGKNNYKSGVKKSIKPWMKSCRGKKCFSASYNATYVWKI